jgi:putative RNA 2'-phosphotransferase
MNATVSISKFLSLVLRHQPQTAHISLDKEGWVDISALIAGAQRAGRQLTRKQIEEVVATSDKKRFAISEDGLRIRAVQGHSTNQVAMTLAPQVPPDVLLHGTATRFIDAIKAEGLKAGSRHHVHLSATFAVAHAVGARHGKVVVLTVDAKRMHAAGHAFYLADNGVWLTDHVPAAFIVFESLS